MTSTSVSQRFPSTLLRDPYRAFAYTIQCALSCPLVQCPQVMNASSKAIQVDRLCKQFLSNPVNRAPKSFFKALFLGTHLGDTAARMSPAKVAP